MRNTGGGIRWEAHRRTGHEGGADGKGRNRTDERDITQDESIGFCDRLDLGVTGEESMQI